MIESRVATLDERHARLDAVIDADARRPSSDDLEVSRLKRERLYLRDEIAVLRP